MGFIEILKGMPIYPGYPDINERGWMEPTLYDHWVKRGRPTGVAKGLYTHPNYLAGVAKGRAILDDGTETFFEREFAPSCIGYYPRDANGRPVHPCAEEIFEAGLAIEGPGAAWVLGPNLCADPIVFGFSKDGGLWTIVVRRRDLGVIALPGGHLDPGESPYTAAMRELREETGINIESGSYNFKARRIMSEIVPDPRTTINAWLETTVILFMLEPGVIDGIVPVGGDDAAEAFKLPVDDVFYSRINAIHAEYIKRAERLILLERDRI